LIASAAALNASSVAMRDRTTTTIRRDVRHIAARPRAVAVARARGVMRRA